MNVLLLTCKPERLAVLQRLSRERGYDVVFQTTVDAACDLYRSQNIDLVIIDGIALAEDAIAVSRRLREVRPESQTVILVVTDDDRQANLQALLEAGATDYLLEPMSDEMVGIRLMAAEQRFFTSVAGDASEQKRHQKELQSAHDELAYRVQQRAEELTKANETLKSEMDQREQSENRLQELQAELAHVSLMSTMGEMVVGLAHEIYQPLTAIGNYVEACDLSLGSDAFDREELKEWLDEILNQSMRVGEIVRGLRRLVQKSKALRTAIDINRQISEIVSLIEPKARLNDIKMTLELEPTLPSVFADRIQINQVLMNLLHNATEALREIQSRQRQIMIRSTLVSKNMIEITVTDNGPGLSSESLDRMFEPYYSTKNDGMGMGLSISRSIIEAHKGTLSATSNDSETGAIFSMKLPVWLVSDGIDG